MGACWAIYTSKPIGNRHLRQQTDFGKLYINHMLAKRHHISSSASSERPTSDCGPCKLCSLLSARFETAALDLHPVPDGPEYPYNLCLLVWVFVAAGS